jgi:hypothetical protein
LLVDAARLDVDLWAEAKQPEVRTEVVPEHVCEAVDLPANWARLRRGYGNAQRERSRSKDLK